MQWMTAWMNEWMTAWMNEWMTAWMNEWMNELCLMAPSTRIRLSVQKDVKQSNELCKIKISVISID